MAVRRGGGILMVALLTLGPALGCARSPASPATQEKIDLPLTLPENLARLAGTATCSARGCHGALEPVTSPESTVRLDEYTKWLAHDKHANAYYVLFAERSKDIIRNLGEKHAAHENDRCLVCHTNGLTREAIRQSPLLQEEALFGVGCETCHGGAKDWLGPHTRPNWKTATDRKGMKDVGDPAAMAGACVKCHVGAPGQEVNHDLIAAGHPRLNFELTAYLADMPPHFDRERSHERKSKADPRFEARVWAAGQLASAEAALRLLQYRADHAEAKDEAKRTPWPEFAEYDCFACHHDLHAKSWRQDAGRLGPRRPGSLAWGSWYYPGVRWLSPDPAAATALTKLEAAMQVPYPAPGEVRRLAGEALLRLSAGSANAPAKFTAQEVQALRERLAKEGPALAATGWDGPAQLYLALAAVDAPWGKRTKEALGALRSKLRFGGSTGERFDSPRDFRPKALREHLLKALEKPGK